MSVDSLSTPCLLLDQNRLRRNLDRMQETAQANNVALRPHAKTHKSPALAHHQLNRGAAGLTVATVSEAETFVASRQPTARDIRIAYPITGREKHERLAALWNTARLSMTVDTISGAEQASAVYAEHDRPMDVLLEIDVGHGRCGVPWMQGQTAVQLARRVTDLPGLRLKGLLTHAGQAYAGPTGDETEAEALQSIADNERDRMLGMAVRLADADIPGVAPGAFEISIGSTPTMAAFENAEHDGFGITEIRPGNYVVHDAMQVGLGVADLDDCALSVLTTVVSVRPHDDGSWRAFVDAGKKVFTTDTGYATDGYGVVLDDAEAMTRNESVRLDHLSEEHGWLHCDNEPSFNVGDRLRIVPNHACVTVANHSSLYLVEGSTVVDRWSIEAHGW